MLLDLHVKNLALIERADIEFGDGLNILTGETGAGKSIIIGSVNIALGGKVPRDIIRTGADYAYIELVFSVTDPAKAELLKEMDVFPDGDGTVSYTHLDVYKRQAIICVKRWRISKRRFPTWTLRSTRWPRAGKQNVWARWN